MEWIAVEMFAAVVLAVGLSAVRDAWKRRS